MATSVKSGFSRSINHPQIFLQKVNLIFGIFKEVLVRRSGVRLNLTASTTGNTLTGFCALAHVEFYLLFVRSK